MLSALRQTPQRLLSPSVSLNHVPKRTWFNPAISEAPTNRAEMPENNKPLHYKPLTSEITMTKTVKIGRHIKITAGGRIFSFSALVMMGTQEGTAGIGYGKGTKVASALEKATRDAEKNLKTIYRFEGRTIPTDIAVKFGSTKLLIRTAPPFSGLRGNQTCVDMAKCFGFSDMKIKTHGSRNPHGILRAFMKAIDKIRSPEEEARSMGKKYVNLNKIHYPNSAEGVEQVM